MPGCGSQVILCDIPVRFDTYKGCSHGCKYCFTAKKYDIRDIKLGETEKALRAFIEGKRTGDIKWCDWDIPLHWGGLSDPFQPVELEYKNSYECLKIFAETQYPFVFSTKGHVVARPEYLELLSRCNCAGQISLTTRRFVEAFEPGAPSYDERLEIARKVVPNVKRLMIRVQPYTPETKGEILAALSTWAELGAYGIILEGLKLLKKKPPCTERVAGDFCIPLKTLKKQFQEIKDECHRVGLKFFCGENRLRSMGDSLCCCGVDGIEGWQVNKANLNHIYFDEQVKFTDRMKSPATGSAFRGMCQATVTGRILRNNSFKQNMTAYAKDKIGREIYGLT